MKTREEVARFVNRQLEGENEPHRKKKGYWHYGRQELRELMDFIYEGEPDKAPLNTGGKIILVGQPAHSEGQCINKGER